MGKYGQRYDISRVGKNTTIGVSEFVKRQSEHSTFTHYKGSWSDLANRTVEEFEAGNFTKGYREGVFLVHMPKQEASLFYTFDNYPMFEGMALDAQWAKVPGRDHEPAKLQVTILEDKISCNYVDIIIYRKDVLQEDKDNTTGADYDIVSINGRLKKDAPPIDPMTLVRNWLHLPGGTEMKGTTPEEMLTKLCDSVLYKNGMKKYMSINKKEK
jgi:hypothetical protein